MHKNLRDNIAQQEAYLEQCLQQQNDYKPTLANVKAVEKQVLLLAKNTIKVSISSFAMPRKLRSPIKRRLQHVNHELMFIRDPLIRAQPKYLGCWSLLERSMVPLRATSDTISTKVLRCIVEVFQDPATKWILIRLLQDELPTEESSQHLDLQIPREQLSLLTSSGLNTDILLRPQDVQEVLSRQPYWPQTSAPAISTRKFKRNNVFVTERIRQKREDEEKAAEQARIEAERLVEEAVEAEVLAKKKKKEAIEAARNAKAPGSSSGRRKNMPTKAPGSATSKARDRDRDMSPQSGSGTPSRGVRNTLRAPGTEVGSGGGRGATGNDVSPSQPSSRQGSMRQSRPSKAGTIGAGTIATLENPISNAGNISNSNNATPAYSRGANRDSVRHASPDPRDNDKTATTTTTVGTLTLGNIKSGTRDQPSAGVSLGSVLPKISSGSNSGNASASNNNSIITANRVSITDMFKVDTTKDEEDSASVASGSVGDSTVDIELDDDGSIASVGIDGILYDSQSPSGGYLRMTRLPDVGEVGEEGSVAEHSLALAQDSVSLGSIASSVVSYKPHKVHLEMVPGPDGHLTLQDADAHAMYGELTGGGSVISKALSNDKSIASKVFNLENFVLPSKRPRSLRGVLVHKNVFTKENPLGRSYNIRNSKKEDNDRSMARDLMSYLRLQPYTGRPCLGLVHMSRKINYASKVVVASQWYRDLAAGKSSLWTNEVTQEWRFVAKRYCFTRIRFTSNSVFELQIFLPNPKTGLVSIASAGGMTLSLMIPLEKVVISITENFPGMSRATYFVFSTFHMVYCTCSSC